MTSISAGSHYTDTDPTSRERAATAGIEPGPPDQESRALPTELPRPPLNRAAPSSYLLQGLLIVVCPISLLDFAKKKKKKKHHPDCSHFSPRLVFF